MHFGSVGLCELVFIRFIFVPYSKYSTKKITLWPCTRTEYLCSVCVFLILFLCCMLVCCVFILFFLLLRFRLICSIHSVGFYCLFLCSRRAVRFCFISISLGLTCRRWLCCFLFLLHCRPIHCTECLHSCVVHELCFYSLFFKSFFINFSSSFFFFVFFPVWFVFGQLFHVYAMAWLHTRREATQFFAFQAYFQALHLFSLFTFNWPTRKKTNIVPKGTE